MFFSYFPPVSVHFVSGKFWASLHCTTTSVSIWLIDYIKWKMFTWMVVAVESRAVPGWSPSCSENRKRKEDKKQLLCIKHRGEVRTFTFTEDNDWNQGSYPSSVYTFFGGGNPTHSAFKIYLWFYRELGAHYFLANNSSTQWLWAASWSPVVTVRLSGLGTLCLHRPKAVFTDQTLSSRQHYCWKCCTECEWKDVVWHKTALTRNAT